MSKIIVIGSSNTDMVIKSRSLPAPGETVLGGEFFMNPGGKGANQAVAAARLGGDVVLVARVGNDIFGQKAIQGFKDEGINTDFIAVDPEQPSGAAAIMVDENGENCIAVAPGANNALSPADVDSAMEQIAAADILLMQLETPMATIEYAAMLGRGKGKTVILNPAPAQRLSGKLLAKLDIITPNETEAELLTGIKVENVDDAEKAARELRKMGAGAVIVTLGSQGAYVHSESFSGLVPAFKVKAVDTTAAGDTFNGALAVGLGSGLELEAAAVFASKAAGISVTRLGAQTSAPRLKEIDAYFNKDLALQS
ncbi:MAG: ribokinase [Lentisphaerota bacterium]